MPIITSQPTRGNSPSRHLPEHISLIDLLAHGITAREVRRRAPWATEYVGLDGTPCWPDSDLRDMLPEGGES